MDEIDKTKVDGEIQKESFIARNIRVKPSHLKGEKGRKSFDNSPVSGQSANLDDHDFSEGENENSKSLKNICLKWLETVDEQDHIEEQRVSIKARAVEVKPYYYCI